MTKYFRIESQITPELYENFKITMSNINEDIVVLLKSPGGTPHIAEYMYNDLKNFEYNTTVYAYDYIDSAAVILFLGFKNRYATENTTYLIHPTATERSNLPQYSNAYDLERAISVLKQTDEMVLNLINSEMTLIDDKEISKDFLFKLMILSRRFSAETAKEYGLVHSIENIPQITEIIDLT